MDRIVQLEQALAAAQAELATLRAQAGVGPAVPGIVGGSVAEDPLERLRREHAAQQQELRATLTQLQLAAAAKSAFLANMSHEIRTPLNGILGIVQLLCDGSLPPHLRDDLETVRHSAESLLQLLNDILDFSKIEAGKLVIDQVEFDLVRTVEDAVELFAEAADRKGVELFVEFPQLAVERVRGDPGRLRQVLSNLLGNAVKFTSAGEVELRVTVEEIVGDRIRLRGRVRDTGIGISELQRARLFRPFVQADAATTRKYGGTGLGLAIADQLCRMMGGGIEVDSELGRGSVFTFTAELQRAAPMVQDGPAPGLLAGSRLLIVERNDSLRASLSARCREFGAEVIAARDCMAAIAPLMTAMPAPVSIAAVLVGVDREAGDVRGLVAWLRQHVPGPKPRIVLGQPLHARRSEDARLLYGLADAVVAKPYRRGQLYRSLVEAMGMSSSATASNGAVAVGVQRTGRRVLVVEDTPVNQRVALRSLERLGYEAELAVDGEEAIEKVRSRQFDLVLMDCQLPVVDGYAATARIRSLGGHLANVPIVAMTADAMSGTRERCLSAGMSDYISKPVRLADLRAVLQRWC